MDKCKHVGRLRLAQDHSILNPQKWHCMDCNTTESMWACLSCSHVACGRYNEEHALKHFQESKHPVALEVNELYVFCYICDDYVLNDNATGDLKLLRSTLSAIKSQNYDCTTRSGRILRSMAGSDDSYLSRGCTQAQLRNEDRMFTALWHRRRSLMSKVFQSWFALTSSAKVRLEKEQLMEEAETKRDDAQKRQQELKRRLYEEFLSPRKSSRIKEPPPIDDRSTEHSPARCPAVTTGMVRLKKIGDSPIKRRPTVTPGVAGLRNLGNTCYMNSILQVLSHLQVFCECFLDLDLSYSQDLLAGTANEETRSSSKRHFVGDINSSISLGEEKGLRRPSLSEGLSGGASRSQNRELIQLKEPNSKHISLCHELHTLFLVMWSGKWALISPFSMLHCVWRLIPTFRGYAQQDAQEFLCELLDRVQQELEATRTMYTPSIPISQRKLIKRVLKVINTIFHGQLLSQVTCLACDNKFNIIESFWDLSLEFPERYHCIGKEDASQYPCLLTEMLAKFTETEALEGKIYACEQCNRKRRKSSSKPLILTEAQKQLMVHKLPQVLRLHLKRFRWSGRNHREKIAVHASFDQVLNMEPYCCRESTGTLGTNCFIYDLAAVVMHHGKGFGSGHYTAYCYNSDGGLWVHCNDSTVTICTVDEVCKAQAYILFYIHRLPHGIKVPSPPTSPENN
ncbi:ubiquitin carboxyl-terminal hydrolase 44 isoform X1 [Narcine bancroftii]|uniref:ubiquitin carboxyl-terminal hydrolase 44 isoform X1 n=1 Tax=Narcine bancroftii TaxID=1343680 RepID=UPI0038314085